MTTIHAVALGATGGLVIDPDGTARVRDLAVQPDGRIADPDASPAPGAGTAGPAAAIDATGTVVLPGFIDAHEHLRSLTAGTRAAEGQALPALLASAARAGEAAEPDDYRALTALATARLAQVGVTSVIDHIYPLHRPGMLRAAIEGHRQVGLRVAVAVGIMTKVPDPIRATPQRIFDLIDEVADTDIPAERLFVAPVSLRQTDLDAYRAAVAFADRRGLRLYTHISESADEVESCLAEHGVRPVQLLERIGFLRPGTVLVHCVHLDRRDVDAIARSGARVAYCPTNHLWLAKGTAPVLALREAGVDVCLGLDGMGDPFAEFRQAIFAQGSAAGDPGALTTDDAFALGTRAGAAAFAGSPENPAVTGTLDPGAAADFVTVPTGQLHLQPMADPLYAVVRHATGLAVRDVVVGGSPIVRDGRLVRADADELIDRARHAVAEIARRSGSTLPLPTETDRDRSKPRPAEDHVTEDSPVPPDGSRS